GLDDSWTATHTALAELGMPILKEEHGLHSGTIDSRTADDDHVRIILESLKSSIPAEGQVTRVSVRVATFGDRPVSDRILYQIGLPLAPANYVHPAVGQAPTGPGVIQMGSTPPPPLAGNLQQTAAPPLADSQQAAPPTVLPPVPEPVRK